MNSKKIQNFVKSKVSSQSPLSVQYSKPKCKADLQEDPFLFETLESDKEDSIVTETRLIHQKKTDISDDKDIFSYDDSEARYAGDCDLILDNQESIPLSQNTLQLRSRVDNIGKSMNSVFKDAQIAINAIIKDPSKKGIRKPSEVAKGARSSGFGKKKVLLTTLPDGEAQESDKIIFDDVENKHEKLIECIFNEIIPVTDHLKVADEHISVPKSETKEIPNEKVLNEFISTNFDDTYDNTVSEVVKRSKGEELNSHDQLCINKTDSLLENPDESSIEDIQSIQPLNLKILIAIGSFLFLFFFISISKFIFGLICGVLMSLGLYKAYDTLLSSVNDVEESDTKYPNLRELKSPVIPHTENTDITDEYATSKASFSTWVSAVNTYNPSSYNIAASYLLHVSLEGTKLIIRKPKTKISSKALLNDRKLVGLSLSSERTIELLHSKVHLLPYGLIRRRMWSKKNPICISINKSDDDTPSRLQTNSPKFAEHELNLKVENYYFYNRTCREKEEMFRRLMAASLGMPISLTVASIIDQYLCKEVSDNSSVPLIHFQDIKDSGTIGKIKDDSKQRNYTKVTNSTKEPQIVTFVRYMAKFMPSDSLLHEAHSKKIDLNYISCEAELLWLNALIGRLLWNVFRGNHWIKVIREKIQKKLKKLRLPYFIDQLEISEIDLGSEIPVIRKVSRPYLDNRGMWVEFEVLYAGGFSMGLETKMNLMKLKNVAGKQKCGNNKPQKSEYSVKYNLDAENVQAESKNDNNITDLDNNNGDFNMESKMYLNMSTGGGSIVADDEEDKGTPPMCSDDSFASSSESDMPADNLKGMSQSSSNNSFPQWVDKITRSSYFQKAADNKFVLRTMEYVSNTSLQLQVDAQYLSGTLVINIPPPPSDRLWYGFKNRPKLNIKARPKVGQKEIQMTKFVEFIEKKLLQEFHRALVMPNMDDITIPLLFNDNPEKYSQT